MKFCCRMPLLIANATRDSRTTVQEIVCNDDDFDQTPKAKFRVLICVILPSDKGFDKRSKKEQSR